MNKQLAIHAVKKTAEAFRLKIRQDTEDPKIICAADNVLAAYEDALISEFESNACRTGFLAAAPSAKSSRNV